MDKRGKKLRNLEIYRDESSKIVKQGKFRRNHGEEGKFKRKELK